MRRKPCRQPRTRRGESGGEFSLEPREFQPPICRLWIFGRRSGDCSETEAVAGAGDGTVGGTAGGTVAGTRTGPKADEAATEVARASGAATETEAGVDTVSAAGFGLTKCDELSPARCGDRTGRAMDRVECWSHGCREAHRQVSYQAEG